MTVTSIPLGELLEETDERLGERAEPEVLTLTEKKGFVSQRERFNKRLAVADTSDYKVVQRFHIAFNPYLLWAGAIAQNVDWDEGIVSPAYPTFRLRPGYEPRYVDRLLRSPDMMARYDAIAFGSVPRKRRTSVADFLDLRITQPPTLSEQRRISKVLDLADALRTMRRRSLAQIDTLTRSIFLDMFGDPMTNPKGWPRFRLGHVSDFFSGSTLPDGEVFTGQAGGFFLLKVSDMNLPGNDIYLKSCQQWTGVMGAASSTCSEGAVVIPKRGASIGTNKKRITTRPSVLDPNLMAIMPRSECLEVTYLYAWLLHLDLTSITSGSTIPQLNKQDLDPLSIPVPPLDIQRAFASVIGKARQVLSVQQTAATELDNLFAALQQRAFRGNL